MEAVNANLYEVHGYIQNGYIILHDSAYDHEDENGHSVYVPRRVAVNPSCILEVEDRRPCDKDITNKALTCLYYVNKQEQHVYESFEEVMDLIKEVNIAECKISKPLYD